MAIKTYTIKNKQGEVLGELHFDPLSEITVVAYRTMFIDIKDMLAPLKDININARGEAETVSGLSQIATTLSGIAGQFRAIADMLVSMGGLVIPEIATGSVVPYKTKIDTSATDAVNSDYIKESFSDFDELLSELIRQTKINGDLIRKKNLNIDISALERAITKQKRGHDLNFGGA